MNAWIAGHYVEGAPQEIADFARLMNGAKPDDSLKSWQPDPPGLTARGQSSAPVEDAKLPEPIGRRLVGHVFYTPPGCWSNEKAKRFMARLDNSRSDRAKRLIYGLMKSTDERPSCDSIRQDAGLSRSINVIMRGSQFSGLPKPVLLNGGRWSLDPSFRAAWEKLLEEKEG